LLLIWSQIGLKHVTFATQDRFPSCYILYNPLSGTHTLRSSFDEKHSWDNQPAFPVLGDANFASDPADCQPGCLRVRRNNRDLFGNDHNAGFINDSQHHGYNGHHSPKFHDFADDRYGFADNGSHDRDADNGSYDCRADNGSYDCRADNDGHHCRADNQTHHGRHNRGCHEEEIAQPPFTFMRDRFCSKN
jgi:hypothetical protein